MKNTVCTILLVGADTLLSEVANSSLTVIRSFVPVRYRFIHLITFVHTFIELPIKENQKELKSHE